MEGAALAEAYNDELNKIFESFNHSEIVRYFRSDHLQSFNFKGCSDPLKGLNFMRALKLRSHLSFPEFSSEYLQRGMRHLLDT